MITESQENTAEDAVKENVETDATPDMAAAANKDVEKAEPGPSDQPVVDMPVKAPEKKEMTPEEQEQHMRMVIRQGIITKTGEISDIIKLMSEHGYQNYVYTEESAVKIPGHIFAHLMNFMDTVKNHNDNLREILGDIVDSNDSVSLGSMDFQTEFLKIHQKNCESGIAKSPEAVDEIKAEENIKEIPVAETKEKARGTKDASSEEE